jgi:diketogulonate reductase-like aldo/keto reductase
LSAPTEIATVDLGGGAAVPMVGFGTWQLGGRRGYEAILYALDIGYEPTSATSVA